ncbi:hypothetical protein ES319_D09G100600v1 [Gossypium barbadense]|uniref:Uncharacterized protein n=1 Tax=Gossypium barbadense TaxID=3634 RepID=A0A5J5Q325_GOSBA|nr:hypothetical protein ES319_D09G100600v1 [Gossypium barbadense]
MTVLSSDQFPSCHVFKSCLPFLFVALLFQFQTGFSALIMSLKNHPGHPQHRRPMFQTNQSTCALFVGTWVRDDSYPLYQYSNCPIIDAEFNCQLYGRPDSDYLKYRWQPLNCVLPRFDGLVFLSKMRGKNVMFVGDSLGRNQWESLICMISASTPKMQTQIIRGDPLSTFRFLEYGLSISFYRAPYLVDIDVVQGTRILKLEGIDENGNAWRMADVLVFNTGHWWTHKGSLQGPIEWGTGATATVTKNCYGETAPMTGTTYPGTYPDQMRVVDEVIREMHVPTYLLDITMLSELRKDGHPSIYSGDLSPTQRANPDRTADCSHWCLPGLPDTWNQLFYTVLFY